ncbi:hypothetical protein SEUCBS139899_006071 [Sporothrix eucalyptigena]|uniref:Uncharacterized protein n=1 Tax=Sporothrix eucalyptigena TaxID=1812306 RepID=A0ABP0CQT6_9PEZI
MANCSLHPKEFHTDWWHYDANTPVVGGKYCDPATGETRDMPDDKPLYRGPPAVDIDIMNQYIRDTNQALRVQRSFPMEFLLCHILSVVDKRQLKLDTVVATHFTIRVILSHELSSDEFYEIAGEMAWKQPGEAEETVEEKPGEK